MKIFIKLLLFAIVAAGIYFVFVGNTAVFATLLEITPAEIAILLLINLLFLLLFAFLQKNILLLFGLKQTLVEWLGLAFIAAFYNLFLPAKGGSVIRSAYLKKKYDFSYMRFVAYLIKQSVYMLIVVSFMIGGLLLSISKEVQDHTFILGGLAIVFSISVYFIEKQLIRWLGKKKKIKIDLVVPARRFFYIIGLISLLIFVKGSAFYIVFAAIKYPISFNFSLLIASLLMLSNLVSVLPGNIGVRELLLGGVLQVFGYDISLVILASLTDRAAIMVTTTLGALVFKYFLFKDLKAYE